MTVASDGRHTLTFQANDLAGNPSSEQSVSFKVDRTAPELVAFAARDAQDPRALNVVAADRTSGVTGGTVQIRKVGSSTWTSLPTTRPWMATTRPDWMTASSTAAPCTRHGRSLATTPATRRSARLLERRPGRLLGLVARADEGECAVLSTACTAKKKAAKHKVNKHAKRAALVAKKKATHKKRAAAARRPSAPPWEEARQACRRGDRGQAEGHAQEEARRGEEAGRVGDRQARAVRQARPHRGHADDGRGRADRERRPGGRLDAGDGRGGAAPRGGCAYRLPGPFRLRRAGGREPRLAFDYEGSNVLLPGSGSVTLRVPASASFRSRPHVVRLHQRLTFSGKLRTMGAPLPKVGKLVYLQAFDRGKWRKFAVLRTRKGGSFSYRFSFEAAGSRGVTYRIKAVVPREAGYAFDNGDSKPIKVRVRT